MSLRIKRLRRLFALLCSFSFLSLATIRAQEEVEKPLFEGSSEESGTAEATSSSEDGKSSESLYLSTLARDIGTADYYELLAWCQRLNLDETGDRATLQSRLYRHYRVSPDLPGKGQAKKRIVIRSASRTEYFTIEEIEEDYIVLQGDVIVEFVDDEENVTHIIRAQRITINQTQNLLTATGDIRYTLKRGDEPAEEFKSRRFSFNMENWDGVFIEGEGTTEREVEPEEWITFTYYGESIARLENDTVILENGTLTSSENTEEPYWHIRASKIYVLAPGEWAIQDAVLHVGRVPMFYVPYFFKPGDELFFHPSLGYRNREGNFVQTTTYLVGRKQQTGGSLSFLRVSEAETEQYEQVIKGLYLRTKKTKRTKGLDPEEAKKVLKILADYYSRLGFFAGMVADYSPGWQFRGGLGVSRNIDLDTTGAYTPFIGSPGDDLESEWNQTRLGALTIPFRYGLETNFKIGAEDKTVSGDFGFFSDPFFAEDFYFRAEDIDWGKVLLGQGTGEEEVVEQPGGWDLFPEVNDNFDWQVATHLVFPLENPTFREVSIPRMDLELYWQSKNDDAISSFDPTRKFYHPSRLVSPNAEFRLQGDLLNVPIATGDDAEEQQKKKGQEPGKGFKLPVIEEEEERKGAGFTGKSLKVPEVQDNLSFAPPSTAGHSFALTYDFYPKLLIESQFDSSQWERARDVELTASDTTLNLDGYHKFIAEFKLWGDTVKITDEIGFEGTFRDQYGPEVDLDEDDYEQSRFDLNNTLLVTYYPFLPYRFFDQTRLSYELDWDYYSFEYKHMEDGQPVYGGIGPEWKRKRIETHEVGSLLVYDPFGIPNSLELTATLPPLYKEYEAEADVTTGPLNSNATTAVREKSDYWEWDPLLVTETLDFSPWIHLQEIVDYDLNDQDLTDAESKAKLFKLHKDDPFFLLEQELTLEPGETVLTRSKSSLWFYGFQVYYLAEKLPFTRIEEVGTGERQWVDDLTSQTIRPSELYIGYDSLPMPLYMWRNRIKLDLDIATSWTIDLHKFTESIMDFSFGLNLTIHKFVEIGFNVVSQNTKSYRYIPAFARQADENPVSLFEDLWKSFKFWEPQDRLDSEFNLKSIGLTMIHHLGDWELILDYSGEQILETQDDGTEDYVWSPVFSIILQWKPIPEIRKEIRRDQDTDEINIRGTVQEVE
jgi:lipopolysaccharide assembly outer membrane protein LptD (OstA)